jgi:anti-sigma factor RsiW
MSPTLEHPEPEQLIAYHERRLSPAEADALRTHLTACADCTTQLLELAALFDAEDDPGAEISREEMDAAWQRQRARFPAAPAAPRRPQRTGSPLRRAWTTAASLGLAASLLAIVALSQWRTIIQLRQAQANPPLVNLAPAGSLRQEGQAPPELRLSAETQRAWVILNPVTDLQDTFYDVDVVAPDGRVVLPFKDLRRSEANNFRLEIPRDVLMAGDYEVFLLGNNAGRRWILERFDLRVRLSPSPAP